MDQIPPHELSRLEAVAGDGHPLEDLVARRLGGEPLHYIEGTAPFGPLDLLVDERVLVPRPETEGLYEIATKMVRNPEVIVDLCTGSGALALALKRHFPSAAVFATDISEDAIAVASENKFRNGLEVYLAVGSLFDPLPASLLGLVDLLVVNPPYVSESEFDLLPEDVKREPKVALVAGSSGLEVIREIGESVSPWLRPGGVVVCEIGESQALASTRCFIDLPTVVRKDLSGRDRYLVAVKP
jgi:release factor glutamine methyltransferase